MNYRDVSRLGQDGDNEVGTGTLRIPWSEDNDGDDKTLLFLNNILFIFFCKTINQYFHLTSDSPNIRVECFWTGVGSVVMGAPKKK